MVNILFCPKEPIEYRAKIYIYAKEKEDDEHAHVSHNEFVLDKTISLQGQGTKPRIVFD